MRENCYFRHHMNEGEVLPEPKQMKRGYSRQRIRNKSRATAFRKFLINTYGIDLLKNGRGVLDVAAGRGLLSYELVNLNDIPTLRIEPRNTTAGSRFRFLLEKGAFHRNKSIGGVTSEFGNRMAVPKQLRICLDKDFIGQVKDKTICQDTVDVYLAQAEELVWNKKGLQTRNNDNDELYMDTDLNNDAHPESEDDEPIFRTEWSDPCDHLVSDLQNVESYLTDFSIVVGMHPDQATEIIADLAISMNKPFACVPCCVFHKKFPDRKLMDGTRVTTYNHFIEYLVEKDPETVRVATLDFDGKNKVVYRVVS
eukprot:CFRG2663T1